MNIDKCLEALINAQCLSERDLRLVCEQAKEILIEESNVHQVAAPVNICGDIHGQFFDLLELFNKGGKLPNSNYIFIGDFVNRGFNSVETFEYLLCLKLKYPDNITLLRGNHESRYLTQVYGFYDEIIKKYGNANPWRYFTEVFEFLPLGALVESKILCVHGGLSPELRTVDQIRTIDRKTEIPHEGPFCDLMWSDPYDVETWVKNERGAGWIFGRRVTHDFNYINGLELIARAHQLVSEGYQYWFDEQLVTVWSAPNYCYKCGNNGIIMKLNSQLERKFIQFSAAPGSLLSQSLNKILPYFL